MEAEGNTGRGDSVDKEWRDQLWQSFGTDTIDNVRPPVKDDIQLSPDMLQFIEENVEVRITNTVVSLYVSVNCDPQLQVFLGSRGFVTTTHN